MIEDDKDNALEEAISPMFNSVNVVPTSSFTNMLLLLYTSSSLYHEENYMMCIGLGANVLHVNRLAKVKILRPSYRTPNGVTRPQRARLNFLDSFNNQHISYTID